MAELNQVSSTVIYKIKVVDWSTNAWYAGMKDKTFECILDVVKKQFSGDEIMFKVLGAYNPIKHIRQVHAVVKSQRIATHKELIKHYG